MPKISCLVFSLLLLVASCRPAPVASSAIVQKNPLVTARNFSIADSLVKYRLADSLPLTDDSTRTLLYIGKASRAKCAVWTIDSTGKLEFYKLLNKRRVVTKTRRGDADKLMAAFQQSAVRYQR